MRFEKSSGAVVFHRSPRGILYLLLHYSKGHWGFPKGHIEENETAEQAALREIREETGLSVRLLEGFSERIEYSFSEGKKKVRKEVSFFLAESHSMEVRTSGEHSSHKWLHFSQALGQVSFESARLVLRRANAFLGARMAAPKRK